MKYSISILTILALTSSLSIAQDKIQNAPAENVLSTNSANSQKPSYNYNYDDKISSKNSGETPMELTPYNKVRVGVVGEGVAPLNTSSPAQAYALARRAAIADGYRMIAEKIKGIHVEGQDYIKNMMIKSSVLRTQVDAVVRNAQIVETTFKDGLCEVEMEIIISGSQFAR